MANIITGCRILCSIILLFIPAFSHTFYILYLVAGFTDMIDGTIARKTNTASEFGSRLDTIADILQEKAAEGWELVSKTGNTWGFRRSKPRTAQFNVEVIDLENPAMELAEFVAYCEAGGWKHAFDAGDIQVFENEDLEL